MAATPTTPTKRYLVLCTGNRCRSQMAHGWLAHLGGDAAEVRSAGTQPKGVHPKAIEVMREVGVDISGHSSDHVDVYAGDTFDAAITVCDNAREACPVFPHAGRTLHHSFRDPDGLSDDVFREVRDEIGVWARAFLESEGAGVIKSGREGAAG